MFFLFASQRFSVVNAHLIPPHVSFWPVYPCGLFSQTGRTPEFLKFFLRVSDRVEKLSQTQTTLNFPKLFCRHFAGPLWWRRKIRCGEILQQRLSFKMYLHPIQAITQALSVHILNTSYSFKRVRIKEKLFAIRVYLLDKYLMKIFHLAVTTVCRLYLEKEIHNRILYFFCPMECRLFH